MRLTRVALTGFKSFVEETEFEIGPGMTGVVGPNGCGKSNLVEALRWAMGEHAPRSVRAAEMDDVIFDGTAARPARNLAEIRIVIDNEDRSAPPAFNNSDTIEICRRIRRGHGSAFFVNQREVRARDVQLLFADSALGARSHAIVAQGQVDAIIRAKPAERRRLLEEAAGIVGVHSRRHEAELRLRSTEENLTRIDDLLGAQQAQLAVLRRQARQAARYRSISDRLRTADARLSLLRWRVARDDGEATNSVLADTKRDVAAATTAAAEENSRQASLQDKLPALQETEAEASAAVQRIAHERALLHRELDEVAGRRRQLEAECAQTRNDLARVQENQRDIAREQAALHDERTTIETEHQNEAETRTALDGRLGEARATLEVAQGAQAEAERALARAESRAAGLARDVDEKADALDRLGKRIASTRAALEDLTTGDQAPFGNLDALEADVRTADSRGDAAEAAEMTARKQLAGTEQATKAAAGALETARADLLAADRRLDPLRAERDTLARQLEAGSTNTLAQLVRIQPGFERAAAAALGEDLEADPAGGPVTWHDLGEVTETTLPAGAVPLSEYVSGPAVLQRRLSFTGVVDEEAGDALQRELVPGQRLVDRTGALWRWDGYTHSSGDASPVSRRFQQKNRFDQLDGEIAAAEQGRREAQAGVDAAEEYARKADAGAAEARNASNRAIEVRRASEQARKAARDRHAGALAASIEVRARQASLGEEHARLAEERDLHERMLNEARSAAGSYTDVEPLAQAAEERRQETETALAGFNGALEAHTRMTEVETHRRQRLETVRQQWQNWDRRRAAAEQHVLELRRRLAELDQQLAALVRKPQEIETQLEAFSDRLQEAEGQQRAATDARAACETALREANQAVTAVNARQVAAREAMARAEGACEQVEERIASERERIRERLGATPDQLPELAGLKQGEALAPRDHLERTLERLYRERDNVGPVNLRAEAEAEEAAAEIDRLSESRSELVQAVEKLRSAINRLNREARGRLRSTFGSVDQHFRSVFRTLFQGGEARLELVDSEDPLEAGLEIVASPPGKQLQKISLLSGGEKTLAALSLIFAMFLTRPAPLCVLDEVDAALDDSNVERFCALLTEISKTSNARMLVITHHPYTMTQMDRLYGATMQEPGVSTLVSVDLAHAEGLREAS